MNSQLSIDTKLMLFKTVIRPQHSSEDFFNY